jgi:hypothetical protein
MFRHTRASRWNNPLCNIPATGHRYGRIAEGCNVSLRNVHLEAMTAHHHVMYQTKLINTVLNILAFYIAGRMVG